MFDNPIKAVQDTLTGCQVLIKTREKKISMKGNATKDKETGVKD